MSDRARRPDPEPILATLKDFQRTTVEAVFRRLYLDADPAHRFLVADEVGLGKTLVAKGVIAKAVDHLWDTVERIDVVYVCSNTDIARQNVDRLNLAADAEVALASRMTLLPITLPDIKRNKLNFVAFTPGTSFDLRSSQGIAEERQMLYHMLRDAWSLGSRKGPKRVLQGGVESFERWDGKLKWFGRHTAPKIDRDIQADFLKALHAVPAIRERFLDLAERVARRKHMRDEDYRERRQLVGQLRSMLATTCIRSLEPDIVILDEFQRFRNLLREDGDEMSRMARELFDYCDSGTGERAKVLLLSATPYKMYTRHHETDDDHYGDFLATMDFLMEGDAARVTDFQSALREYREALYRLSHESVGELRAAASRVEGTLRRTMVRNERLQATGSVNAMVADFSARDAEAMQLEQADVEGFVAIDRLARAIDAPDNVEYWKSAPYLPNFLDHYKFGGLLDVALEEDGGPSRIGRAIDGHGLLDFDAIERYAAIDPENAKLRLLTRDAIDGGAWRLLWVPPSLPYTVPSGAYAGDSVSGYTKSLIFSAWKMVPKVIATLASYDAERRIVAPIDPEFQYSEFQRKRRPLLRFAAHDRVTASGETVRDLSGMSMMPLLYPCITLAEQIDPLRIAATLSAAGREPTAEAVLERAEAAVAERLRSVVPATAYDLGGNVDQAWYWAAPARLDGRFHVGAVRRWLQARNAEDHPWPTMLVQRDEEGGLFAEHMDRLREQLDGGPPLGRVPDDLARVVALTALASPAICALRALRREWREWRDGAESGAESGDASEWRHLLPAAASAALGFRTLFNLPEATVLLRELPLGEDGDDAHWQRVLRYALDGNLQSVLDEYVHILRSSLGLIEAPASKAAWPIGEAIKEAAGIRTNNLRVRDLDCSKPTLEEIRTPQSLRCRFAMGFGMERDEQTDEATRDDHVRVAFNSPFRPFVLATTSIGQEGLDFHWYCHRLYHWNLPSNPVDLEQREGRVNRYKGHAVRRNVAGRHGGEAMAAVASGEERVAGNPWPRLFELAKGRGDRPAGSSDLDPYWIYEAGEARVERHVPALPLSRDHEHLAQLVRSLVAYRLVFGQPRQEDLVAYLTDAQGLDAEFLGQVLGECRIDLSS